MKKTISIIIACVIISSMLLSANGYCIGDVNTDYEISAADARFALRAAVGLDDGLTAEQLLFADTDGTDGITASDARLILRAAVGLESFDDTDTVNEIPRFYFYGDLSGMTEKKDERKIRVVYSSDDINFSGYAKIKPQGTSSLAYDKKNYTINLYNDSEFSDKMKIDVGWGEQSKYCLKANWIDKTHARNIVTANIAAEAQHKYGLLEETPANGLIDGFPIEIYINNEFAGIYTFNIPKDAWMFNMDEDNPDHIIFCNEGYEPANLFFAEPDFNSWALEAGPENEETLEKLSNLFDFVMNSSDEEFRNSFEEHLNLDATLNYYILANFAYLRDNQAKNMLLVTYDGKLWYPSLYDLDTSWGTYWNGSELYNYEKQSIPFKDNNLWAKFEKNFSEEISVRYSELREEILTKEHITEKFNTFTAAIPPQSFEKEAAKWGPEIPGYDIGQIEEFLDYMIPYLDTMFGYASVSPDIPSDETETSSMHY